MQAIISPHCNIEQFSVPIYKYSFFKLTKLDKLSYTIQEKLQYLNDNQNVFMQRRFQRMFETGTSVKTRYQGKLEPTADVVNRARNNKRPVSVSNGLFHKYTRLAILPLLFSNISLLFPPSYVPYYADKCEINYMWVQEKHIVRLDVTGPSSFLKGQLKTNSTILAFCIVVNCENSNPTSRLPIKCSVESAFSIHISLVVNNNC